MAEEALTTTLSTKGQIILPAAIRKRRHWGAGLRLIVEETAEGVLLKPAPLFARSRPDEVFGMLPHRGPPKSIDDMDQAIAAEARRRHARHRY